MKTITTMNEVAQYINNSDNFNQSVLEKIAKANKWLVSDDDETVVTNGREKVVMNENGTAEVVVVDDLNEDHTDFMARIEANKKPYTGYETDEEVSSWLNDNGYEIKKSLEDYYYLVLHNERGVEELVYEDPACEDSYDFDSFSHLAYGFVCGD